MTFAPLPEPAPTRVVACLSGGVDSSVAAALLREAGHEVLGVFMRSGAGGAGPGEQRGCCSVEDALDARRVADALGIPFYALNMEAEFGRLVDRFAADYAAGRTPNPCVLCNRWLKFGHVLAFADRVGATHVASGHYARVVGDGHRLAVARPVDRAKDQSYVLAVLEQAQLARLLLPLGGRTKAEVRALARARGLLRVADKRDSQELCFVPGDYREVLRARLAAGEAALAAALAPGEVVDLAGAVLGRHEGTAGFTVGQRRGLGVAAAAPLYVVATDPAARRVVVGPRAALARGGLVATDPVWLGRALAPGEAARGQAQLRAHGERTPCVVTRRDPAVGAGGDPGGPRLEVRFERPAPAVVPGQALVVYDEADEVALLSGWIEAATDAPAAGAQDAGAPASAGAERRARPLPRARGGSPC